MALFSKDEVLQEYPLKIKFVNEIAYDGGGVCRDMFSGFWNEAYKLFFDGSSLLVPVLHPNVDMLSLPKLGTILSHGYLVSGFLPTRIAFPALANILLGLAVKLPSTILVETFASSLSSYEAGLIKESLASSSGAFSKSTKAGLVSLLSRYGCRVCPTPQNLESLISSTANFEFLVKPLAAFSSMRSGIPPDEEKFWQSYSVEEFYNLYMAVNATPKAVLAILDEPYFENSCEARIFGYLQQFIGNMSNEEVRRFLRYTTGSTALLAEHISVTFNVMSGLGRRPIAHTCGCILELPTSYLCYPEFEKEFDCILSDDEYTWEMHAV